MIVTCIIGLEHEGKVYVGGDSATGNGWGLRVATTPKVFRLGELLVGFTDTWRFGQLLQYSLVVPQRDGEDSDERYLIATLIPAIRSTMKDHGYVTTEDSRESAGGAIIGYRGRVYELSPNFGLTTFADKVAAVGVGWMFAEGAMLALEQLAPKERILKALEIVGRCSDGVLPPFTVMEL